MSLCCCFGFRRRNDNLVQQHSTQQEQLLQILQNVKELWPDDNMVEVGLLASDSKRKSQDPTQDGEASSFHLVCAYPSPDDLHPEHTFGEQQNDTIANLIDKVSAFGRSLSSESSVQIHLVGKDHLFSCLRVDPSHLLAVWVEKEDVDGASSSPLLEDDDYTYSQKLGQKYECLREISNRLANVLSGGNSLILNT